MNLHEWYAAVMKIFGDFQYFIAGLLGASVVTRYHAERLQTRMDHIVFILSGAITAHYLTQLVIYLLNQFGIDFKPEHTGGIGFLLGAFGGMFIQEFISWIKTGAYKEQNFFSYFAEIIREWLSKGKK